MTTILFTHLDSPLTPDLFDYYLSHLSITSQQKILRLRRYQDQHASVMGKMLLLKGLQKFGYPKKFLKEIIYNGYNRPLINLPIDFSISHSGQLVVCALSDNCKLGIDVEEIRPVKIEDFKDALSTNEYNDILIAKNSDNQFFNIWTRKEAVVKANGKGLFIPLTDIILENDMAILHNKTWYLREIFLSENYSSSLATDSEFDEEPGLNRVNKEDFTFI